LSSIIVGDVGGGGADGDAGQSRCIVEKKKEEEAMLEEAEKLEEAKVD
jgi:hypothetical protein